MYMYEKSTNHYIVCLEGVGPSTESSDEDWTWLSVIYHSYASSSSQTWYADWTHCVSSLVNICPHIIVVLLADDRSVMDSERRAALMHFDSDQVCISSSIAPAT